MTFFFRHNLFLGKIDYFCMLIDNRNHLQMNLQSFVKQANYYLKK